MTQKQQRLEKLKNQKNLIRNEIVLTSKKIARRQAKLDALRKNASNICSVLARNVAMQNYIQIEDIQFDMIEDGSTLHQYFAYIHFLGRRYDLYYGKSAVEQNISNNQHLLELYLDRRGTQLDAGLKKLLLAYEKNPQSFMQKAYANKIAEKEGDINDYISDLLYREQFAKKELAEINQYFAVNPEIKAKGLNKLFKKSKLEKQKQYQARKLELTKEIETCVAELETQKQRLQQKDYKKDIANYIKSETIKFGKFAEWIAKAQSIIDVYAKAYNAVYAEIEALETQQTELKEKYSKLQEKINDVRITADNHFAAK